MRVIIERGAITNEEHTRLVELGADVRLVARAVLESAGERDMVLRNRAELEAVLSRGPVSIAELRATPVSASVRGKRLALTRVDLAILYELVAAAGSLVPRSTLLERCWSVPPQPDTLNVAVFRLRSKVETKTDLRITSERDLGYRIVSPKRTRRVLVVEDDLGVQAMYRLCFAAIDVHVEFATSVPECKTLIAKQTYDAYFVDLGLPGGSGADAIRAIRRRSPQAPIMIVSGQTEASAVTLSARLGVLYAVKPVSMDVLQNFVMRS